MKRFSLILLPLLFAATSAMALDLAEMQESATRNREIIKRYQVTLEKSGKDLERARSGYYPSLDIGYQVNNLDEPTLYEHRENSSVYSTVTMNLFAGFRDRYSIESAQILQKVEGYRLQGVEQDIQLNVALRYLSVYERKANLTVTSDAYKTLERIYQDGQKRLQVGLIGKNELLKFKVDLDNANITEQKGQADLDKGVQLLGREINQAVSLEELSFNEFSLLPQVEEQEVCQEKMLTRRSELLALEGLTESASVQVKAEQGAYYPRLDMVGSYSRYDDDFINGEGEITEEELRAQMVLSMNIFDGFSRESTISRAKLTVREIQYDLAELKSTLTTDLANLFIDYRVSMANVEVAREDIRHAEENLRITQLKYKEGLQRESDLLDAVTNLSRARYNEVAVIRTVFENAFRITRMVEGFRYRSTSS
ncbi:MAG: TolC family protein [Proteobacteria bacterium]|nr:TolC family protein [Pseudomonadota bacterium]MBU1138439.1 TolC family protein [Pseudomonadota bacterium]MBU1232755.1 TolC family protein [Pseudomonadota bacterium]MBU1418362.1 TolC family protein [Pseudomonadota bacterium]MBU1455380.1 TolC family protein [Pseudomonadota bacterium]